MGKGKKVTRKVVGSANGSVARGAGVDGSTEKFAVEGMGLQTLPIGVAEGSGEESNVVGVQDQPVGPPAPQPHGGELQEVDPGSQGEGEGGVTAVVQLTSEQQGQTVRERFTEDAKQKRLAKATLEEAAGAEQRALGSGRRVSQGGEGSTGLGIDHGVFDAVYTPAVDALSEVRYGRNNVDKSRCSPEVA